MNLVRGCGLKEEIGEFCEGVWFEGGNLVRGCDSYVGEEVYSEVGSYGF